MHQNLTPHTWIHRNRHSSGKCTEILALTHECTEIIFPQVNALESYPSHMNAPKSSLLRNIQSKPYPSYINARNHPPSSKCTGILPLTHECTKIITPLVNAQESYPSHLNAPKSSSLKKMHRNLTPHTWMHHNRHSSGTSNRNPTPHTRMHRIMIPKVNAPNSCPSHMNAPKPLLLR